MDHFGVPVNLLEECGRMGRGGESKLESSQLATEFKGQIPAMMASFWGSDVKINCPGSWPVKGHRFYIAWAFWALLALFYPIIMLSMANWRRVGDTLQNTRSRRPWASSRRSTPGSVELVAANTHSGSRVRVPSEAVSTLKPNRFTRVDKLLPNTKSKMSFGRLSWSTAN
jgi:hypothetical protein